MDEATTFGAWLRERRRGHNLTQEELADRLGCAIETIRKIEAGSRRPTTQMLESIARELGVPPEEWPALLKLARGSDARVRDGLFVFRLGQVD